MSRTHTPPLAIFAPSLVVVTLVLAAGVYKDTHKPDPFDQRNFPCQEDEALMYDPYFGPDHVGCIPVNQVVP